MTEEKRDPLDTLPEDIRREVDTLYDLFDVTEDTPTAEIKAAYKEKIKRHHPDNSDRDDAEQIAFALNRAIDVVGEESERILYDRLGHTQYFNTAAGSNNHQPDPTDKTEKDVGIYEMIQMTNFNTHRKNKPLLNVIVGTTGFKVFLFSMFVLVGLFGMLLVI